MWYMICKVVVFSVADVGSPASDGLVKRCVRSDDRPPYRQRKVAIVAFLTRFHIFVKKPKYYVLVFKVGFDWRPNLQTFCIYVLLLLTQAMRNPLARCHMI